MYYFYQYLSLKMQFLKRLVQIMAHESVIYKSSYKTSIFMFGVKLSFTELYELFSV